MNSSVPKTTVTELRAAGRHVVRAEKRSGTDREGRTELRLLLDFLRRGDALVVNHIDRLARSLKELQDIVHELKAKGVALKATEQPIGLMTVSGIKRARRRRRVRPLLRRAE